MSDLISLQRFPGRPISPAERPGERPETQVRSVQWSREQLWPCVTVTGISCFSPCVCRCLLLISFSELCCSLRALKAVNSMCYLTVTRVLWCSAGSVCRCIVLLWVNCPSEEVVSQGIPTLTGGCSCKLSPEAPGIWGMFFYSLPRVHHMK